MFTSFLKCPRNYWVFCAVAVALLAGCADNTVEMDRQMDLGSVDAMIMVDAISDGDAVLDGTVVADALVWPEGEALPSRAPCSDGRPPVVMIHGFLASGDTWSAHKRRFIANGLCPEHVVVFDWNTLDRNFDHVGVLDQLIDELRERTNSEKVDLIGHSAGGGLGYDYLADENRNAKVRRYVHVGSFANETPAGPASGEPTTMLNLWSRGDLVVEGADIPGATNVMLEEADHYEVATSFEAFQVTYEFLYGESPIEAEEVSEDPAVVSGRFITFGENKPVANAEIQIWEVSLETGARIRPVQRFSVGDQGEYGPIALAASKRYEFLGKNPVVGGVDVRHYFESFTADNELAYVRGFPGPGSIAGALVNLLPKTEAQSTLVIYNGRGAFLAGRDSLTLNGQELLNEQSASAENTSIALFVYDIDGDNLRGGRSPLFDMFPFLAAVDEPLPVTDAGRLELIFNGRTLILPSRPATEGIFIAIFD